MARPLRIDDPGGWHHVMNRGVARAVIYAHDRDRLTFEKLMAQLAAELGIEIHAYCLMGNHFHLLLHCPNGGVSTFMQQLSSSYTRIVNERLGRDGPLFRGRFHSVPVLSERQIAHAAAYIHRNPIDLVPAAALDAFRWSSYGVYLGRRATPTWLTRSTIDTLLPPDLHRELVAQPLEAPGNDGVTTGDIDAIVRSRIDPKCPDGKRIRLLLGFELAGLTAEDVADWIGLTSAGAARTALARARSARRDRPVLTDIVTDLETRLRDAM
jgi:REP element-mobilizing transposase RayT